MDNFGTQDIENELFGSINNPSGTSDAELLKYALLNEKASPDVLAYEDDLITRIESHIDYQEEQTELMSGNPDMEILRTIYASEVSRIRYLLRSYLRTRLLKIEKHVMHILDNPLLQSRLSEKEASYAREYFLLIGNHFKASIATHLPDAFSSLVRQASAHPSKDMIPTPDLDKHVFCQVVVDQGPVVVDEQTGDTADFNKGDVFVVRYKPIKELVENGSVRLI